GPVRRLPFGRLRWVLRRLARTVRRVLRLLRLRRVVVLRRRLAGLAAVLVLFVLVLVVFVPAIPALLVLALPTVASLPLRRRRTSLLLLLRRRLLLRRLLAQPVLDRLPVRLRVGVRGIELQRAVVGLDRILILAFARQRVAEVVDGVTTRRFLQHPRGGGVVARTVGGCAAPRRIARQLHRLFRVTLLQCLRRLLVAALPQVAPGRGVRGTGQHRQQHQRQQQQPAAAERQCGERQQEQQQPGTAVLPFVAKLALRRLRGTRAQLALEHGDVAIVRAHGHVAAAARRGHGSQRRIVAAGQLQIALRVVQEAAAGQRHRRAVQRAHAEHGDTYAFAARLAGGCLRRRARSVGDQHQRTATDLGVAD